jgi:hypothetical protein
MTVYCCQKWPEHAHAIPHGDKGFDSKAIGGQIEENGTILNIASKATDRLRTASHPSK